MKTITIRAAKPSVNRSNARQVLDCGDGVFGVAALGRGGSVGDELQSLERSHRQSGNFADSVNAVQEAGALKTLCALTLTSGRSKYRCHDAENVEGNARCRAV